jgi:glutamine amidotransferase
MEGKVLRFKGVRIPHMGWNNVNVTEVGTKDPLMKGIPRGTYFYFANSYAPAPTVKDGLRLADSDYGRRFPAIMRKVNTYGTQFHPEKSGTFGLTLIGNFVRFAAKEVYK